MGRRHTAGAVGYQAVGGLQVDNTTFTAADNLDIVVDPSGTGIFKVAGDAQLEAQGDLRFADADSSNYVAFQAPATVSSNLTWTLPDADGTLNQMLTTNGSGTLSWTTAAVAINDNTSDSGTNYLAFTTATSGSISAARVSSTKLTFQPSTGLLSSSELTVNGTARSLRTDVVKTTSHTLELADRDRVVAFNGTGSQTVTVPLNSTVAFPIGSVVYINRVNSGSLTLAAEGGVTLTKTGAFAQNEEIYVRKRNTDSWIVVDSPATFTATGGSISNADGRKIHTFTTVGSSTFDVS
jgi:hypothetical protein